MAGQVRRALLLVVAGVVATAGLSMAGRNFERQPGGDLPDVEPEMALVCFVRPDAGILGKHWVRNETVVIDDAAVGFLPPESYIAVSVEPGRRLVWGATVEAPRWFRFDAGGMYVIRLEQRSRAHDPSFRFEWIREDPASMLTYTRTLGYVTLTDAGASALRRKTGIAARYDRMKRLASAATAIEARRR